GAESPADVHPAGSPDHSVAPAALGSVAISPAHPDLTQSRLTAVPPSRLTAFVEQLALYAFAAWLAFALVAIVRLGLAHVRLARWLAPRQPVDDPELLDVAHRLAQAAGLRGVRLSWSPDLYSPVALGRREVCLPSAAFEE